MELVCALTSGRSGGGGDGDEGARLVSSRGLVVAESSVVFGAVEVSGRLGVVNEISSSEMRFDDIYIHTWEHLIIAYLIKIIPMQNGYR